MTPGFYRQGDIPIDGALLYHPIDGPVVLAQDIYYLGKDGRKYWAHERLETDGASIPKLAWRIIGIPFGVAGWGRKHPSYLMAALVHDDICAHAETLERGARWELRKVADLLFDEMLDFLAVPGWKVKLMYPAVRVHAIVSLLRKKVDKNKETT